MKECNLLSCEKEKKNQMSLVESVGVQDLFK